MNFRRTFAWTAFAVVPLMISAIAAARAGSGADHRACAAAEPHRKPDDR
jgi:hypothetical protein